MEDQILGIINLLTDIRSPVEEGLFLGIQQTDSLLATESLPSNNASVNTSTRKTKTFTSQLHGKSNLREFLKLQDNYVYNLASRIIPVIDKLQTTEQIVLSLDTLQGLCLLHYPSRKLFNNDKMMQKLLNFLEPTTDPVIHVRAINTLVSVMVREVKNIRKFEQLDGLKQISLLFKSKEVNKEVKLRILEFLFFYLIPETKHSSTAMARKADRKTTEEKAHMLGKYLSNVSGLVRELNTSKPFGDMVLEW